MKKIILGTFALLLLAGCGSKESAAPQQAAQEPAPAEIQQAPSKPDHNYAMKDGLEYGYEPALSADAQNAGQAASKLMMFKYAGEKDGKHQVYFKDGPNLIVAECSNPCDFVKTMQFFQQAHIKTERLRAAPELLIWLVLEDAMNGKLEQYHPTRDGKKYNVWFTEEGPKQTPASEV